MIWFSIFIYCRTNIVLIFNKKKIWWWNTLLDFQIHTYTIAPYKVSDKNCPWRIQNPSPEADWKIRRISLFFQLTKLFSVQSRQAKNAKKHIVCISWLQSWQLFQPSSMDMYSFEYCQGHFKGHFKIRRNVFESLFSSLFSDKLLKYV